MKLNFKMLRAVDGDILNQQIRATLKCKKVSEEVVTEREKFIFNPPHLN